MTTTNFNVGLMNDNRNSSRVLKPPGGGHTDLFGPPEPITPKVNPKASQISQIFGSDNDQNSNCSSKKKNLLKSSIVFSEEENENKNQTNNTTNTEQIEKKTEEVKTEDNVDNNKTTEEVQKEVQKPKRVPPGGYSTSLW